MKIYLDNFGVFQQKLKYSGNFIWFAGHRWLKQPFLKNIGKIGSLILY